MTSDQERISTLEAQREADVKQADELEKTVRRIDRNVQDIQARMSRQKGFIAGVLFILAPLWAMILIAAKPLWDRLFS